MSKLYTLGTKAVAAICILFFCTPLSIFGQGVGIEEDTPEALLEVSANGGSSDLFMLSSDDNNDGDLFILKNSGEVGIGTSSPGSNLVVREDVQSGMGPILTLYNGGGYSGAQAAIDFNTYDVGANDPTARISVTDYNYSGHIIFSTKTENAATNPLTERVRIESSGEVGIGTSAPVENVHIDGGAGDATIRLETDDGYSSEIQFWDGAGAELYRLRYDDADNRFEIKGYNGGLTDRIRLPDNSDNIEGDGTFQDTQFGPCEWLIGQGDEGDVMCISGAKEDEDGMIRAIAQVCTHTNCPNVIGVAIPKDESPHHGNPDFEYKDKLSANTPGEYWEKSWKKRHVGIELTGFRMTKVIGKVEVGDLLVSSGVPGYAMASKEPGAGAILGKATQPFNGKKGERGFIWARIHLQSGSSLYQDVSALKKDYHAQKEAVDALRAEVEKLKEHIHKEDSFFTANMISAPFVLILLILIYLFWKLEQRKTTR